jgi:hypothetical protein
MECGHFRHGLFILHEEGTETLLLIYAHWLGGKIPVRLFDR